MSTPRFVLFHGSYSSPESNWIPWLSNKLKDQGFSVTIPLFPTPEGQSLENWSDAFSKQVGSLEPDMVLVGHSMGVGMILRLLEKSPVSVRASFLVAGWEGLLNSSDFDPVIESFYQEPLDFEYIKKNCSTFVQYHGDNDPYVPLELGEQLAINLNTDLKVIDNGGHLNSDSGFNEFPKLFEDIEMVIKL